MSWILLSSHLVAAAIAALVAAAITRRSFASGCSNGTGVPTESQQASGSPRGVPKTCAANVTERSLPNDTSPREHKTTETVQGKSVDVGEECSIEPFSDWAVHKLLGHSQVKKIAALYLHGSVTGIKAAIKKFGLDDVIVGFMSKQCSASTNLKALSLQMSRAFARDALSAASASSNHFSKQLLPKRAEHASTVGIASTGAGTPPLPRGAAVTGGAAGRAGQGSEKQVQHRSEASQLGLVGALSLYQEGTMGGGVAAGLHVDGVKDLPVGAPTEQSCSQVSSNETSLLTPSPTEALAAQAVRFMAGTGCIAAPASRLLEKFGCRTILTYLMRELEALLTMYLSQNWDRMEQVQAANESDRQSVLGTAEPRRSTSSSAGTQQEAQSRSSTHDDFVQFFDIEDTEFGTSPGSGNGQGMAKQGSMSSTRSGSSTGASAASPRARRNWQRAMQAYVKQEAVRFLNPRREFQTMAQLLQELAKPHEQDRTRDPIFLFLGGGMAAGKSTVREVIRSDSLWSKIGSSAVVIEADAIKDHDVVLQELRGSGLFNQDDAELSQFVHDYSTKKAQGALVAAVNEQRDIIFDGTCSWEPFVLQTINMLRDHVHDYQLGPGYQRCPDGSTIEQYWVHASSSPSSGSEAADSTSVQETGGPECLQRSLSEIHSSIFNKAFLSSQDGGGLLQKRPYRIELVGVTCAAELAVARGFWRQLQTRRGVPVHAQLRSFQMFAQSWPTYCEVVDSATLYHTGSDLTTMAKEEPEIEGPRVIAHVSASTWGQLLVEPCAYREFQQQAAINSEASGVHELYPRALVNTSSVLRCPSHKQTRVNMLRTALGDAGAAKQQHTSSDPKADIKMRRAKSSTLDTNNYHDRQVVSLPDAIEE